MEIPVFENIESSAGKNVVHPYEVRHLRTTKQLLDSLLEYEALTGQVSFKYYSLGGLPGEYGWWFTPTSVTVSSAGFFLFIVKKRARAMITPIMIRRRTSHRGNPSAAATFVSRMVASWVGFEVDIPTSHR
jgi:hypothetical protein